jgi:hypothetical protein
VTQVVLNGLDDLSGGGPMLNIVLMALIRVPSTSDLQYLYVLVLVLVLVVLAVGTVHIGLRRALASRSSTYSVSPCPSIAKQYMYCFACRRSSTTTTTI